MKEAILEADQIADVVMHRHRRVSVCIEQLRLPKSDEGPPLAIERTYCAKHSPGYPVILVHGFAQNRYSWCVSSRSLPAYLASVGFDVLNLELRGHGNSRKYGSKSPRCFHDYVEDLVRVVQSCEKPPFVIGHSLGAGVGVGASTLAPLAGLIHLAGVYQFGRTNRWLNGTGRLFLKAERPLRKLPMRIRTGLFGEFLAPMIMGADLAMYVLPVAGWVPGSVERELVQERIRKGFDWISIEIWLEMAGWARGREFPYQKDFKTTDVPLLVIAGDRDKLLSPMEARACYEDSGSSDKTFRLYERAFDGTHWGHLDLVLGRKAPEIVWPEMAAWMQERC